MPRLPVPSAHHLDPNAVGATPPFWQVPFFQFLEPRIIATLVLCMRSRIYLPFETVIHQGDVGNALFFIRGGGAEVLKKDEQGKDEVRDGYMTVT